MRRSKITGIGMHVPPNGATSNSDLEAVMDTSDEWITQRSGIRTRYWSPEDSTTSTSTLGAAAAREALADAGLAAEQIDMIIFATLSPDASFPGSGCFLQDQLDVPGIPALDIRQQCTGFIYGLSIADLYIRAGQYDRILLVGAEMQSKCLEKATRGRDMTVLFGDGAGAVIVEAVEVDEPAATSTKREPCVYSTHLHADGKFARDLLWESPGTRNRVWNPPELVGEPSNFPQMNGRLVFTHAVKRMPEVTFEALEANGVRPEDVDLFVNHQANIRINDKFADALGVGPEKVFNTICDFGNTTAATIPIGLYQAQRAGVLQPGMLVATAAFGSGFTWASALLRW
ncbi:MAG: beta-ketoacyl-ACP synthase 3 [Planctomycetota bacterium]